MWPRCTLDNIIVHNRKIMLTLPPNNYSTNISTDLGVGLKIMGGVKCDRCHNLHAVITSVFATNEDLHPDIKEGKLWSLR